MSALGLLIATTDPYYLLAAGYIVGAFMAYLSVVLVVVSRGVRA